jgi:gluconate 5-dehydrogenase
MPTSIFSLYDKNVLITGGAQGIGLSLAEALGQAGATVLINARNEEKLNSSLNQLHQTGISAKGILFDVNQTQQVRQSVEDIETHIGPIDILVNNAGIIKRAPAVDMEEADWELVIQTNLTAPYVVSKYVARHMIQRNRGKIINICSLMSEVGRETVSAYAAAKGGLKMLTRNLAAEWGQYNIQVNGIGPGFIATPINTSYREAGNPLNEYIIRRTPAGRWGTPQDLGGTAVFLSSRASDFVNGQIIYVDGGLLASFGKPAGK